jgi:hypothetical protein
MNGGDNSWFSERTKTWIVSITMAILVGGSLYGFYAAQMYKAEREEQKRFEIYLEQRAILQGLQEIEDDDN